MKGTVAYKRVEERERRGVGGVRGGGGVGEGKERMIEMREGEGRAERRKIRKRRMRGTC